MADFFRSSQWISVKLHFLSFFGDETTKLRIYREMDELQLQLIYTLLNGLGGASFEFTKVMNILLGDIHNP